MRPQTVFTEAMIRFLFTALTMLSYYLAYGQFTVQFRIISVYSNVADMDGLLMGDSDPLWEMRLSDGNNIGNNFSYQIVQNCPGQRTVNHYFDSKSYNCAIPNFTGRWRGLEDDGPILTADANTGWIDFNINAAALTVRNGTWAAYPTFEATASGTGCNTASANNRVVWRINMEYRITGAPVSTATVTFNPSTIDICHGNRANLTGNISAAGNWTVRLNNGQQFSGNGNGNFSWEVQPTQTTTYFVQNITSANVCGFLPSNTVTVRLPTASGQLSNDNESATCVVNANETVHFFNRETGNYIATVQANATGLGTTTARSYLDDTPLHVTACENIDPQYANHVMQRHWVIKPTTNASANVRLPYTQAELNTLSEFANSNVNPSDDVTGPTSIHLSKYSGGPNALNVNRFAFDNCAPPIEGGYGGTTVHLSNQAGNINYLGNLGSHLFSSFSIPGFSEFWLHGNSTLIPLNNDLQYFEISCEKDHVNLNLNWVSSYATQRAVIEYSHDGENWDLEKETFQQVVTLIPKSAKYYRVKLLNAWDEPMLVKSVVNECKVTQPLFYPNPAQHLLYFELGDWFKEGVATLDFIDLQGRTIYTHQSMYATGQIDVETLLPEGMYLIYLKNEQGDSFVQKIEIR